VCCKARLSLRSQSLENLKLIKQGQQIEDIECEYSYERNINADSVSAYIMSPSVIRWVMNALNLHGSKCVVPDIST